MPNPRNQTVVEPSQIPAAVAASKQGRSEIRMDRLAILHAVIGRKSFPIEHLKDNLKSVYETVTRAKPEGVKGPFIKGVSICSTMGPGHRIALSSLE